MHGSSFVDQHIQEVHVYDGYYTYNAIHRYTFIYTVYYIYIYIYYVEMHHIIQLTAVVDAWLRRIQTGWGRRTANAIHAILHFLFLCFIDVSADPSPNLYVYTYVHGTYADMSILYIMIYLWKILQYTRENDSTLLLRV